MFKLLLNIGMIFTATSLLADSAQAQEAGRTLGRVFWQDSGTQTVYWGDLQKGQTFSLHRQEIASYPMLDSERQMLVQMQAIDETILIGVRDDEDGDFQSGWIAIDSGVTKEEHGDHFHLRYDEQPSILHLLLDDQQGNPAHVYAYAGDWYLANDKKNGFTKVSPTGLVSGKAAGQFFLAGGGHITIAVSDESIAYATWIDRDGENKGRVDVRGTHSGAPVQHSFYLPYGGIHGATYNTGKAFFAPAEGICWVSTETSLTAPVVNHLDLGQDSSGASRRTGAFTSAGQHVIFTTGRGPDAEICFVNAASPKPSIQRLSLDIAEGNAVASPSVIQTRTGRQFAILFEENKTATAEKMLVVELDPNRDGSFSDAALTTTIAVGKSQIQGHSGHHEAVSLGGRYVLITNPGDGTMHLYSTSDWTRTAEFKVGGAPTRLVAY